MRGINALLSFSMIVFLFMVSAPGVFAEEVTVGSWYTEVNKEEMILEPGTTAYCNKDFKVENMGSEMAEVRIVRGNGDNYDWDSIPGNGTMSYKLHDRSPFATDASQGNWTDDARIVNSTLGSSKLKVYCK